MQPAEAGIPGWHILNIKSGYHWTGVPASERCNVNPDTRWTGVPALAGYGRYPAEAGTPETEPCSGDCSTAGHVIRVISQRSSAGSGVSGRMPRSRQACNRLKPGFPDGIAGVVSQSS